MEGGKIGTIGLTGQTVGTAVHHTEKTATLAKMRGEGDSKT